MSRYRDLFNSVRMTMPLPIRLNMLLAIGVFVLLPANGTALDQDLLKQGKDLYKRCQGCHQIGPDAINQFGPPLNGLATLGAGRSPGFDYSPGFLEAVGSGLVWNEFTLDAFLAKPMDYIPGTKMTYPGVKSINERKALVAFLTNLDTDGSYIVEPAASNVIKTDRIKRAIAADQPVPDHGVLHLGRKALPEEVLAWDIDIRPDGTGLPPGRGNALQGLEIYDIHCNACHGDFGEGVGRWPVLAGGADTLTDERPEKTIGSYWPYLSTVFDYVRRAMPFGNARSLSDDDVYAVTAYLLYLNDLAEEDFELSSENFTSVRLPNESGFVDDDRPTEKHYVKSTEPCTSNCIEGEAKVVQRARILDVTPDE